MCTSEYAKYESPRSTVASRHLVSQTRSPERDSRSRKNEPFVEQIREVSVLSKGCSQRWEEGDEEN